MNMSVGESTFDGINFGVRRRLEKDLAERVVLAVEGDGPRRSGRRRTDDEPGAGLDRPVRATCSVARRSARTRAQDLAERGRPAAVGIYASPIFTYRSALPLLTSMGMTTTSMA